MWIGMLYPRKAPCMRIAFCHEAACSYLHTTCDLQLPVHHLRTAAQWPAHPASTLLPTRTPPHSHHSSQLGSAHWVSQALVTGFFIHPEVHSSQTSTPRLISHLGRTEARAAMLGMRNPHRVAWSWDGVGVAGFGMEAVKFM